MAEMLVRVDDITDELLRQLQHAKTHKATALIGELEHRIAARIEEQWMEPADKAQKGEVNDKEPEKGAKN